MISILIVDDEMHAVEGIKAATNWSEIGIDQVYTAYSMRQAQQVFEAHTVDIMLCDIEMPKGSGLDLLRWIRERDCETENLFLTSHANFSYANQAIKLGSLDYLLKPISKSSLEQALRGSVERVCQKRAQTEQLTLARYWSDTEKQHMRQFWLEVINESVMPSDERISQRAAEMHVPIHSSDAYLPVLVRIHDTAEAAAMGRSAIGEAVSRVGRETVFPEAPPMLLSYDPSHLIIMDAWTTDLPGRRAGISERCAVLCAECAAQVKIRVSCYVGEYVPASGLSQEVRRLVNWRMEHVTEDNGIFDHTEERPLPAYHRPPITDWMLQLGSAESGVIVENACDYLDTLVAERQVNRDVLTRFFHDFMQELYVAAHRKQIQANLLIQDEGFETAYRRVVASVDGMKRWVAFAVEKVETYIADVESGESVVHTVRQYIRDHLTEELGREHLAKQAFLNPEYLSRLFRKQTGTSLSDYITAERVREAKILLRTTDLPIGDIAFQTGYNNWAYFSKIFKKQTGITPQQYRSGKVEK